MASSFLLVHVFTAFLPPRDPDEGDYYDILGLANRTSTTPEDIRKAYKAKSLQLHPDKVAQRGEDAASAALLYERVQEAYACLHEPKHRQEYHQLQCSPTWYRFVSTGGLHHPMALHENLQQARVVDKTRLVALVTLFFLLVLLQPILVAAKVNQTLAGQGALNTTSWVVLLIPLWILHGALVLFLATAAVLTKQAVLAVSLAEHACWLAGEVLLATQWDRSFDSQRNWHIVAIPFYLGLVLRACSCVLLVGTMVREQMRMVSPDQLRADHPDWTDEEFLAAEDDYCVVTVDDEAVAHAVQLLSVSDEGPLNAEDLEALRVQLSPEYQATSTVIQAQCKSVLYIVLFGFTFVALVASKLQDQIAASWWTVFIPIWIYLGQTILYFVLICCCLSTGDAVVVVGDDDDDDDDNDADVEHDEENPRSPRKSVEKTDNSSRPVSSSVNFASVEGSMREFNEPATKPDTPSSNPAEPLSAPTPSAALPSNIESPPEETMSSLDPAESSSTVPTTDAPPTAPPETTVPAAEVKPTASGESKDDDENNDNDNGDHMPHLDEDTFRAWQHAQAKAEASAMEQQARALSGCCMACFQLMIVCLVVGKLQQDYEQPDPSGYSAFWILFPVFLVVGILLCCCACLIYGSGGSSSLDNLVERARAHEGEGEAGQAPDRPSSASDHVSAPPPVVPGGAVVTTPVVVAPDAPATDHGESTATESRTAPDVDAPADPVDMNDLD